MRCSQIKLPLAQRSVLKVNCTHVEHVAEVFRCCSAVLATLVATAERRRQIELQLVYAASWSADRCYGVAPR